MLKRAAGLTVLTTSFGTMPSAFAAGKSITVGIAWPGMIDEVWTTSRDLLTELAAKSDPRIEIVSTVADMDIAKQSSDVKDLISKGVDVVVVAPVDSKAIVASVKNAHEAKIPVMAFLRPVGADAKYPADIFVGIDATYQQYSAA